MPDVAAGSTLGEVHGGDSRNVGLAAHRIAELLNLTSVASIPFAAGAADSGVIISPLVCSLISPATPIVSRHLER